MRASHDLFDYGFSEDSPTRLPAVSVEVAAGVYSSGHTFQSPEAAALGDSVCKVWPELQSGRRERASATATEQGA
jgi:hypothetical protein